MPFVSDFVTFLREKPRQSASSIDSPVPLAFNLPLDWLFDPLKRCSLSARTLARLVQQEMHEPDVSLRDDIRIAQLIVLHCERGDAKECSPAVLAWYEVLGCHPDQVWPRILARRQWMLGQPTPFKKFASGVPRVASEPQAQKSGASLAIQERKRA